MKLWMNDWGMLGYFSYKNCGCIPQIVGCQYPEDSFVEHLGIGGIFIGALVDTSRTRIGQYRKYVTTTNFAVGGVPGNLGERIESEMAPDALEQSWYRTSTNEDSKAVSESDYYTSYIDTVKVSGLQFHTPLGVKVLQRSYAWASLIRQPILPLEYNVINIGNKPLSEAYLGFYFTAGLSLIDTDLGGDVVGYWPEIRTAYATTPVQFPGATPIGITLLDIPKQVEASKFRFHWSDINTENFPCLIGLTDCDTMFYDWMSGAAYPNEKSIKANQSPNNPGNMNQFFSIGPFSTWQPGETLKVTLSLASGHGLEIGADNLKDNAHAALTLYNRHYVPPIVLPAPKLYYEFGDKKVTLSWAYNGTGVNPMDIWDDENAVATVYPPDHWRRINPPSGHIKGGRVFEGFRLYRSEDPGGTAKSFTLIKQWDMIDSVGPKFEVDTGIETTYVDSNLQTGKTYWYAVTSFGIPDLHVIDYLDFDGVVKKETLLTKSAETSVLASRRRVNLPFSVSHAANQVLVVPNPYRVDENYTLESGGWEGRDQAWNENKRLIRFIHLPPRCKIQIFSLTGDLVTTLEHDDPIRGDLEWNLISESGRALASGVYVFQVDSEYGKQVGKFVLIR